MAESSVRFVRKLALLAKKEVSYGTDSTPTGEANAIQASNATLTPLAGADVSRDLLLPHLGHQGIILTGNYATLQFDVEIAGAGAAGTPPAWGVLMEGCGFAETVTEDTDVAYSPVSSAFAALSQYFNLDGVNHILLGARGTWSASLVPAQIPRFTFNYTGLVGTIADTALPSVDLSAFVTPVPVSKANTTMSLHGWTAIAESLQIQAGNTIEPRMLIGEESIKLSDRQATGTAVVQAMSLATKNWFSIAQAATKGVLATQHGTVAGNIVKFDGAAVQLGRPTQGATQGIANYSLPLMFTPDEGNDELIITVK